MMLSVRMVTAAFVTALVLTAAAPAAQAGTYTVYGCTTPYGTTAPMDGWHIAQGSSVDYWKSLCPGAAFMWMSASRSHANGDYIAESFVAPANTTIRSYTLWRAVRLVSSDGYYYQIWDRSAGQWRLVGGCASASGCKNVGSISSRFASSNRFGHTGETGTTEVQVKLVCGRSGGCPSERSGTTGSLWLFQSAFTLEADSSPQFAGPPTGPLVTPGALLAGVVPVTLGATDRGGGVYQGLIEIDGRILASQVLNSNGGRCQLPFVFVVPCQGSANGTLYFDTRQLADGGHSLTLLVSDAAGNVAAYGPIGITTLNNPCSPSPTAGGMRLQATFVIVDRKRIRVHRRLRFVRQVHYTGHLNSTFLQRPLTAGVLTTASGQPLGGAPVCIAVQNAVPGAPLRPAGGLVTNSGGGFSHQLAPGPSRTIYFIHRVMDGAIWGAVSITVNVPVNVHLNHHFLHNRQVMTWSGHLPGPVPDGLIALMQVWRGTYWQTFEQIGVAQDGNFVGRYRFFFTSGVQHYKFRLMVPHQSFYPYAAGTSAPIHVTVTG